MASLDIDTLFDVKGLVVVITGGVQVTYI